MPTEKSVAAALVDAALSRGLTVSVCDGEAYPVKRSTDRAAILAALWSTDEDRLILRRDGALVGWILLVWGNEADGSDLVADYSDNEATQAIVNAVYA